MATKEHIFSLSFTQPQTNEEHEGNMYNPMMDEEEGFGDSEDNQFGADPAFSTGVIDEMATVGLTISTLSDTGPSAFGSQQKRKRGEGPSRSKKFKIPVAKQLANAVSIIANVSLDRAAALTRNKESSIPEVMKYLMSLEEVKHDKAFGVRCMQALEPKIYVDDDSAIGGEGALVEPTEDVPQCPLSHLSDVPQCLLSDLKELTLREYDGWKWEFEIVRYIMENVRVLRTISIHCICMDVDE